MRWSVTRLGKYHSLFLLVELLHVHWGGHVCFLSIYLFLKWGSLSRGARCQGCVCFFVWTQGCCARGLLSFFSMHYFLMFHTGWQNSPGLAFCEVLGLLPFPSWVVVHMPCLGHSSTFLRLRSIGFCAIWVCVSSSSTSLQAQSQQSR